MPRSTVILIFQIAITLFTSIALVAAQTSCDVDIADVIDQVQGVCTDLGDNQICYGNFEVNAITQDNAPVQDFTEQGDLADVAFIRSLFLSGLDPDTSRWGIAQMRLVTPTSTGTQDINLLLFGDVEIENEVEPTKIIDVVVGSNAANVRNSPRPNSLILASAPSGEILQAVGRLADDSWVRVTLADGSVGWLASWLVSPVNDSESLDELAIQDNSTPYFGPMQAFSFTDNGESQCGNITTDGLLIQTSEGSARVTLLINEVSIELLPSQNGATAIITANPIDGMTISVIDGEAQVSTGGTSFFVNATQQTTIALDNNLTPIGAPSIPQSYDVVAMSGLPVLPVLRTSGLPIVPVTNSSNTNTTSADNGANTNTTNNTESDGSGSSTNNNNNNNANGNRNGNQNGNQNGNGNG
ncbi:MAG: SH3 domain-containing protein [Phototrophicaceae bacterium]